MREFFTELKWPVSRWAWKTGGLGVLNRRNEMQKLNAKLTPLIIAANDEAAYAWRDAA